MNQYERAIFLIAALFATFAVSIYHFMVFRVNRQLPPARRLPYLWGHWNRLASEYKGFYPRTSLPSMMRQCAIATFLLALAMVGLRVWEYAAGK